MAQAAAGEKRTLRILIKADQGGPAEALADALGQLSNAEVQVEVIHRGVGADHRERHPARARRGRDHHRLPRAAGQQRARRGRARGRRHQAVQVIYEAVDDVRAALEGMLRPEEREVVLGEAEVRETFKVPKHRRRSPAATCATASITRQARVRVIRDGVEVYDGTIALAPPLQGRREGSEGRLRVRYRHRELQRHQGRRRHRVLPHGGSRADARSRLRRADHAARRERRARRLAPGRRTRTPAPVTHVLLTHRSLRSRRRGDPEESRDLPRRRREGSARHRARHRHRRGGHARPPARARSSSASSAPSRSERRRSRASAASRRICARARPRAAAARRARDRVQATTRASRTPRDRVSSRADARERPPTPAIRDSRPPRDEASTTDGLLLVDKPAGMTSHDVVLAARRAFGESRIGHAGTLDPFATGLLVLLLGTRHPAAAATSTAMPKVYEATIVFGRETDTDDLHGAVVATRRLPDDDAIADGDRARSPGRSSRSRRRTRRSTSAGGARTTPRAPASPLELAPARVDGLRVGDVTRDGDVLRATIDVRRGHVHPCAGARPRAPLRQRGASRRAAPDAQRPVRRRRCGHRRRHPCRAGSRCGPRSTRCRPSRTSALERGRRRARRCAASPCRARRMRRASRWSMRGAERCVAVAEARRRPVAAARGACGRSADRASHRESGARPAGSSTRRSSPSARSTVCIAAIRTCWRDSWRARRNSACAACSSPSIRTRSRS